MTDSGLRADTPTLCVALLGADSIVQVYPSGLRQVRSDGRVNEWPTPKGKPVAHAAANSRQVALSLSGGEVLYFEIDAQGLLVEMVRGSWGSNHQPGTLAHSPPG